MNKHLKPRCSGTSVTTRLLALAAVLPITQTGCSPLVTVRADGMTTRHYFGYVRLVGPNNPAVGEERITGTDVSVVGLRIENGVTLGFAHDRVFSVPLDCRAVFLMSDKGAFDAIVEALEKNHPGQKDLCALQTSIAEP